MRWSRGGVSGGSPAPVADYQPSFRSAESNLIIMMSPGFFQRSLIYLKERKRERERRKKDFHFFLPEGGVQSNLITSRKNPCLMITGAAPINAEMR